MKIIQVIPDLNFGGAEIMCENLTRALIDEGHNVLVVSLYTKDTTIASRMQRDHIKVIFLEKTKGVDFSIVFKLRKIFKQEQPDVIHTHRHVTPYTFLAAYGMNIKMVHTIHSIASKENNKIGIILNKLFFKKRIIPVALSELVQETIIEVYAIPKSKVPVIYNGIPLEKCMLKNDYNIKGTAKILHIGRYTMAKNHFKMIEALVEVHKQYPNIQVTFLGDGELKKDVKNYIGKFNASSFINMAGTTDSVYPYLRDTDIFILPSIYEGMPMTLIEAMGTACPIIASNVGGIPNMIDNSSGVLIKPDVIGIKSAILDLLTNKLKRETIAKNALKKSESFSSKNMAKEYIRLYNVL